MIVRSWPGCGRPPDTGADTGLLAARHVLQADLAVVTQGPGNLGTGTPWGFSGVAAGEACNAVTVLGGEAIGVNWASVDLPRLPDLTAVIAERVGAQIKGGLEEQFLVAIDESKLANLRLDINQVAQFKNNRKRRLRVKFGRIRVF